MTVPDSPGEGQRILSALKGSGVILWVAPADYERAADALGAQRGSRRATLARMDLLLYLDQNYLSGIVKRKVAFRELESTLRGAVARGAVAVPESEAHRLESAAWPDLPLLGLLRQLPPA